MSEIAAARRTNVGCGGRRCGDDDRRRRTNRGAPSRSRRPSVFDVSPSLAIEAARTRLRLFVDDNPEARRRQQPWPTCPSAR